MSETAAKSEFRVFPRELVADIEILTADMDVADNNLDSDPNLQNRYDDLKRRCVSVLIQHLVNLHAITGQHYEPPPVHFLIPLLLDPAIKSGFEKTNFNGLLQDLSSAITLPHARRPNEKRPPFEIPHDPRRIDGDGLDPVRTTLIRSHFAGAARGDKTRKLENAFTRAVENPTRDLQANDLYVNVRGRRNTWYAVSNPDRFGVPQPYGWINNPR